MEDRNKLKSRTNENVRTIASSGQREEEEETVSVNLNAVRCSPVL